LESLKKRDHSKDQGSKQKTKLILRKRATGVYTGFTCLGIRTGGGLFWHDNGRFGSINDGQFLDHLSDKLLKDWASFN
jgi:hypothetical protein